MDAPGPDRLWTLAEANAALPQVRTLLAEARKRLGAVRDAEAQLRDLRRAYCTRRVTAISLPPSLTSTVPCAS
ncbi:MAG: DUF2203 domain-containing protein [Halobacteriales archaeon]|nr:DUF2203 domain-containing protein [Halobacteriales archaeon]